ncbi:MAG TPA: O-acetylhomoserine aminocarboxypropyltransferase [SAR86 cluster bacterium]|jgi:O-acetylhomoserine (thiol)-lyase|nr:O-acetylhomoserine aminocarboxypropyltransferase [SAR86 cluster bacterium]|tara:strand:+ start:43 stop:1338 length:1296 start_codon:yes stop_codon:yes gene_type:complete
MKKPKDLKPSTLSLHAGQRPDSDFGARATPIYQSSSFVFPDTETAAGIFNVERAGHVYSRITNPTNAVLEERISALEGGIGAITTASGQAALVLAITTILEKGSHLIASKSLYGGSHNLLEYTLPRFGIDTTFVDLRKTNDIKKNLKKNTKLIFGETLGNPGLDVLNIPKVSKIAHDNNIPLLVDSTFTTPYLMQPLSLGADLIFHSATKFLSGHGVVIGGLLVDGGKFDWGSSAKFKTLTEPYEGFHDMNFVDEYGPAAYINRARKEGARDFGACMSPHTAFLVLQGIETLSLRMERHIQNTRSIVDFLDSHQSVKSVCYPELDNHPDHKLAKDILPKGCGAVFTFQLEGNKETGKKFIEQLNLFSHLANVGDAKSLVIHPASTTHHRMSNDALKKAGITESTIRLSVGIEDCDDLIEDLDEALTYSTRK